MRITGRKAPPPKPFALSLSKGRVQTPDPKTSPLPDHLQKRLAIRLQLARPDTADLTQRA